MSSNDKTVFHMIILTSIFVASLLSAQIIAGIKIANIMGFILPAGFLAYAITFPITDIVDEVYGKKYAVYIVWSGFIANIVLLALVFLGYIMPPLAPEMQSIYEKALVPVGRIVVASMIAYLVSQHHDVWAFLKWREITGGKHLWIRNNFSTIVSQGIDTILFISIAFMGVVPNNILLQMILYQWMWKVIIALADTPFVYIGVTILKGGINLGNQVTTRPLLHEP